MLSQTEKKEGIKYQITLIKQDKDTKTTEEIKRVEDWINNRPMKVLGFKTPYEKYLELTQFS